MSAPLPRGNAPLPVQLPEGIHHPFTPAGRVDPFPAYRWWQRHDPVHFDSLSGTWLITSHADCSAVLRDSRFSAAVAQRGRAREDELPVSMLTTDPPEHQRLRAPGTLLLGPAAIRSVQGDLERDIGFLLDGLQGPVDAVGAIGSPLALMVYSRLFGIAPADQPQFAALASAAAVNIDPLVGPTTAAAGRVAMGELSRYLDHHIDTAPDCPLLRLAADGRLSRPEVLSVLGLAVVGGWQPLQEMVGNALYWLLPHPEVLGRLAEADGQDMAWSAIDELLRLEAPIPFTARAATDRVELPGGAVPAGARLLIVVAAANRDPTVFDRPEDLMPDRSPNPHLAFGAGVHFCLAAALVRAAGAAMLPRLARRLPGLAAGSAELRWDPRPTVRRLLACPIDFGDDAR